MTFDGECRLPVGSWRALGNNVVKVSSRIGKARRGSSCGTHTPIDPMDGGGMVPARFLPCNIVYPFVARENSVGLKDR